MAEQLHSAADVAFTNGGGIRGNKIYDAGHTLTRRDVLTELPVGNERDAAVREAAAIASRQAKKKQGPEEAGKFEYQIKCSPYIHCKQL